MTYKHLFNITIPARKQNKMPKVQRTAQFRDAITSFMSHIFIDTGILQTWSMQLLTENTKKNKHDYVMTLPYAYPAYTLEKDVVRADGTVQTPGQVYLPQQRPPVNDFCSAFCDYFERFRYIENGRVLSSIELVEIVQTDELDDMSIYFQVVYYKSYQPYPIKLTREQELEAEIYRMRDHCLSSSIANNNLTQTIYHMSQTMYQYTAEIEAYAEKCSKLENALQKNAIAAYKMTEPTNCPVCFDEIVAEQLYMPVCSHRICKTCSDKCERCPLCREPY